MVEADIPIVNADGLILGATSESAMDSLAAKIWMIENAEHTVDLVYYIFRLDLAGYAMIGAMCNAVHRGVDVRFMVDAVGSLSTSKTTLRALELCEERAGFMRNADGELTDRRARIQVAIFNAVTNLQGSPNRRSHDKFLVKDGLFADKAFMMTGGRNISNEYYGFTEDGEIDPHTYRDSDILYSIRRDYGRAKSRRDQQRLCNPAFPLSRQQVVAPRQHRERSQSLCP